MPIIAEIIEFQKKICYFLEYFFVPLHLIRKNNN